MKSRVVKCRAWKLWLFPDIKLNWFCLFLLFYLEAFRVNAQNLTPEQAVERMELAEGLKVSVVASEPLVRQPVAIDFDDRGRLWAIQYLQYPNPAGLNRVKVDRYSRTEYDRVPEPPPHGPKGADRLTILEDTDGDGRADRSRDFISGLNITTGFAFGDGGVYVLQAPYLLHYADRNKDDIPDAEPRVLLKGFGMEDAHSVANSLTWGNDGWLYGLQGSTVTARIRGVEFQQGVWRYHPPTERFELFAEGGGNMWGLDLNQEGELIASTNFGPFVALHVMQDAYYWKQFGKHGPLHNRYTFGYFEHMVHANPQGGHVSAGGLFYEADAWPKEYRGRYVAANVLSHWVAGFELIRDQGSYRTKQTGILLDSKDPWFAPCDLTLGPDGNVYVADWHDERMAHPDPDADWDRTNGRIYVIQNKSGNRLPLVKNKDWGELTVAELIRNLADRNVANVRRARRVLKERREKAANAELRGIWKDVERPDQLRREAFWTLVSQIRPDGKGSDEILSKGELTQALGDRDTVIRRSTLQAIGDHQLEYDSAAFVEMIRKENNLGTIGQAIATVGRLPARQVQAEWRELVKRVAETKDRALAQRLWWATERLTTPDAEAIVDVIQGGNAAGDQDFLKSEVLQHLLIGNLVKKLAYVGNAKAQSEIMRLVGITQKDLIAELLEAMRGGAPRPKGALKEYVIKKYEERPELIERWELAALTGSEKSREKSEDRQKSIEGGLKDKEQAVYLKTAAEMGWKNWGKFALAGTKSKSELIRSTAWQALGRLMGEGEMDELMRSYGGADDGYKQRIRELMLSKADGCERILKAVESGQIPAKDFALVEIGRIDGFGREDLNARAVKIWGRVQAATAEERLAEVRRLNNDVRAGSGDAVAGRELFRKNCATCHQLNGEGRNVGPDLTGANRSDRQWLLTSLVDPSGVIRKEYQPQIMEMKDGRILDGLVLEQSGGLIKLINTKGEETQIAENDVAQRRDSPVSIMPEGLYRIFKPQELRDLFSYLQKVESKK